VLEQELKLTAPDEDTLDAVLAAELITSACTDETLMPPRRFLAVYYDTESGVLERARCALRVRWEGEGFRAAFKLPGNIVEGLSQREEYEADIDSWISRAGELPEGLLREKVAEHIRLDQPLQERVRVDMQRTIRWLRYQQAVIELVVDQGTITGLNGETELYEVELELKQGPLQAIIELGEQLVSAFELIPSTRTKYEIGLSL